MHIIFGKGPRLRHHHLVLKADQILNRVRDLLMPMQPHSSFKTANCIDMPTLALYILDCTN